MNFEEFLNVVAPKVGPNSAFDLSRDARIKTIEKLLIDANLITQEQFDSEMEHQLSDLAENIKKMPPFPRG